MKAKIVDFINNLILFDYLLFSGIFLIFILLLAIAIYMRNRLVVAIFFVLLAFVSLTAGSIAGYINLHQYLYKNIITLERVQVLEFSDALLIKGSIKNSSSNDFKECTIKASVHQKNGDLLDYFRGYMPFQSIYIKLDKPIKISQSADFKILLEPFEYKKAFNTTVSGKCK